MNNTTQKERPLFVRILLWILCIILIIATLGFAAYQFTPWPSALIIRNQFNKAGKENNDKLITYLPAAVTSVKNQQYIPGDDDAYLDVYYPDITQKKQPVIVWIHGGGWVAGSKDDVSNYCKILAGKKYTVIAVDYSLAPGSKYPKPLQQVNAALKYIKDNTEKFNIDTANIILAGDSGGAHIAAQMANIISSSAYAKQLGIVPAISRNDLKCVILFCGAYDMKYQASDGLGGEFVKTVLWSYSGTKDYTSDPGFKTASVIDYVTEDFPPVFISAGNADPLAIQSKEFSEKLSSLGVDTDVLIFPESYSPPLPHEYQFNFENEAAKIAMERYLKFIKRNLTAGQ